jgi:lipoprotein-anchoring transpeptidase ErfK/SrfK
LQASLGLGWCHELCVREAAVAGRRSQREGRRREPSYRGNKASCDALNYMDARGRRRILVRFPGRLWAAVVTALVWFSCQPNAASALDLQTVNAAELPPRAAQKSKGFDPAILRAQVLLDRAGFSPGEIDGRMGDNISKAIAAFAAARGLKADRQLTPALWSELIATSNDPALIEYTITADDVKGPFLEKVPTKIEDMRGLHRLAYGSAVEALAEKFHISEGLLKALNPKTSFEAGQTIVVANVNEDVGDAKVVRIEIDKSQRVLRAFNKSGDLVGVFPATVGSREKPAPTGIFKVTSVKPNPTYRYNPDYAFKGVKATQPFMINPGPNNPVGLVWIGLSAKSYGIHGTPNPSQVSKTESHGCVRLTNWDAKRLAAMVGKGTTVEFSGSETSRQSAAATQGARQGSARRR